MRSATLCGFMPSISLAKHKLVLLAALAYAAGHVEASAAVSQSLPSLSEPALSPDRSEIAFISGGDIWTVPAKGGVARLLVSHPATESRPLYSPDGKHLAFTSMRTGGGDIYVLNIASGETTRITYSDTPDLLDGWSYDGKWLYFESNTHDINASSDIFRVSASGGTPLEVARDRFYSEFRGAPSPDGQQIALVAKGFSRIQWWRHGHSHLDESEIWLKGIADSAPYKKLVAEDAKQGWPMWSSDGKELFYTSDRTGAENVFRQSLTGGAPKQLTQFRDGRLLWPSISYDGHEVVFERSFTIWKMDTKSGKAEKIPIELRGSPATPAVTHQVLNSFTRMALSPDGKKVATIAHGEVFASSSADGGDAVRVTRTPEPESGIRWSSDSNRIVYASTRTGHSQLFEYDLTKNSETRLATSEADDEVPVYSPDGKALAFVRSDHELHVMTLTSKADKTVASGDLNRAALCWSPDSKFLAYTEVGAKSFRNISVVAADGTQGRPVSFLADGETGSGIAWSPDGKYLLFDTGQRSETSKIARIDLIPHLPSFKEDQFRDLFKNKEPATQLPNKDVPAEAAKKPDATADAKPAVPKKDTPTRVVFEGIRERLTFLPLGLDAGTPVISPDGKTLVIAASVANQQNLYSYSLDERAKEPPSARQLTSTATRKSDYWFSDDSKLVFFLDNGKVSSIALESRAPKSVAINAAMDIDFDKDKVAAFQEGWGTLNRRFYDPKFHGRNWSELQESFFPYVLGSRTPDEMRRAMGLMIGELNASHSGVGGGGNSPFSPTPTPVGRLGLRFDREAYESGQALRVREVIPLGPAAIEGSIKVGETLFTVDGENAGPIDLDSLLQDKVGRRVVLQVGTSTAKREVVLQPVSNTTENGLLYRAWVEANRAYVEKASGGKLGYVHIADMSERSLTQLFIDLDAQNQSKQGVVIDIRDNNGGFVNEYALDVFTRKNYLTMTPRGGSPAPARPFLGQRALGTPTVLVTNQGSLSDAEDFTEGYRALKLGKVVGEPTAGWIIYTGGTQLVDGSTLRIPFIRVQDAAGKDMEMHPRPVDVAVERQAGEWLAGKDTQLDRAVQVLLASRQQE